MTLSEKRKGLEEVKGFYDDVNDKQQEIEKNIISRMLRNKQIKKIDLALEMIMKNGHFKKSVEKKK